MLLPSHLGSATIDNEYGRHLVEPLTAELNELLSQALEFPVWRLMAHEAHIQSDAHDLV